MFTLENHQNPLGKCVFPRNEAVIVNVMLKWCFLSKTFRKYTKNVRRIDTLQAEDRGRPPPRCFAVVPRAMLAGSRPFGGAVKMCIICLWARLVRSWYQLRATWTQLGSNLDPTWTQLGTNSSQHVKINTKVTPKWSKSEYRATCWHRKIVKIHWGNVYFQETRPL